MRRARRTAGDVTVGAIEPDPFPRRPCAPSPGSRHVRALFEAVEADDVWMTQRREGLGFARDETCPPLRIRCTLAAARSRRASSPGAAVSWSPNGKRSPTGIGTEIAGVPSAVHGVFMLESPVDASPHGAGPVAEGARITGVVLYMS